MSEAILTADPNFLDLAWVEFKEVARKPKQLTKLADGVLAVSYAGSFAALGERLRQQAPAFIRHICPADHVTIVRSDESDFVTLQRLVRDEFADDIPTGTPISVQTRFLDLTLPYKPSDVNRALSDTLTKLTGAELAVNAPQQIVSCNFALLEKQPVVFCDISHATHNLSTWPGGERRYKRDDDLVSRAEFKLLEAIEWFHLKIPARGLSIDLGAAPGGWTRVIRQMRPKMKVVAVDPGDLHESLKMDLGVKHARVSAETYRRNLAADTKYDLILNDMRLDARRSADTMILYANTLAPKGVAVMTIKLPQHNPRGRLNATLKILRTGYNIEGVKQFFHNRNEVTVLLSARR